jgi:hypothetical protein
MLDPARTFLGEWWLPDEPGRILAGTLSLSGDDGLELETLGTFGPGYEPGKTYGHAEVGFETWPRVSGRTTDNKLVTLLECRGTGLSHRSPGVSTNRYRPATVLIGAIYEPGSPVDFDEVRLRFTDLDTWATVSGFGHSMNVAADNSLESVALQFRPPPEIVFDLEGGDNVRLSFDFKFSGPTIVMTTATITQSAWIGMQYAAPVEMPQIHETIKQLRNFLAFAVGRPVRLLTAFGVHYPDEDAEPDPFTKQKPRRHQVEIVFHVANPESIENVLLTDDMLFTRASAGDRLGQVLNSWWTKEPLLQPVFDLYFATIFGSRVYGIHRFLSHAQALETYHRRTANRRALPKAEFKKRRDAAVIGMPEDWREWLERKLDFANELTLRERVQEIVAQCPPVTERLIGDEAAVAEFVALLVDTRNYRTHYTTSLEKRSASGLTFVRLTYQMQALVESALLHELGFACEEVAGMLDRAGRFAWVANVKSQE